MFTQKSITWIMALTLLTVVALGLYGLPDLALAGEPDDLVTDANSYITYLDSLRDMGQEEASLAQARHARDVAVFDHSSYLVALHERAAALSRAASDRPTVADANRYISHLDQLRARGSSSQPDANAFITQLDQLRQKGLEAAGVSPAKFASR